MVILVDMDNTLVEFSESLARIWRERYPGEVFVSPAEQRNFHPHKDYPKHLHEKVHAICHEAGFIRELAPTPGGIDAVREMLAEGYDVRFVTSHLIGYDPSVLEKFQWVEDHFNREFVDRIVLTRDKTLIRGDILVDDKPVITGSMTPTWTHVIYGRPYNRDQVGKPRLSNWADWRATLAGVQ
jgi:5'-nucleotidase